MIIFAKDCYHPQIKALWQSAFGESEESIEFYFAHRHKNNNMLIYLQDETIAAMLTMLPLQIHAGGKILSGRYIYAVATTLCYRGKGLSTKLLNYAHKWMKDHDEAASILVPASESLFDFYGKRGYKSVFQIDKLTITSSLLPSCPDEALCLPCNGEDFFQIRARAFGGRSLFAEWDREALDYEIKAARYGGEDVYHLKTKKGDGCVVYERRGNTILVKELALVSMELKTAVSILHKQLGKAEYLLRLPKGEGGKDALTDNFGMIHWLTDEPEENGEPPYLALVLD